MKFLAKKLLLVILMHFIHQSLLAQTADSTQLANKRSDSMYISEIQDRKGPLKLLHAEPLYIDLIRDLGARKGEREWNVGLGLTDNNQYDMYTALVEYEFAPINRLGLEVELPFSLYYPNSNMRSRDSIPSSTLNSIKLAGQYTILVNQQMKTSMAMGYIHEFELTAFKNYKNSTIYKGNVFNPFFVAAKRWGQNFHTLVYTGPYIIKEFDADRVHSSWQINTSFHYLIPGTKNFLGIEFNKETQKGDFDMTIRPQLRLSVTDQLLVGIVTGIPIKRENERFSSFIRLIYEPKHRH